MTRALLHPTVLLALFVPGLSYVEPGLLLVRRPRAKSASGGRGMMHSAPPSPLLATAPRAKPSMEIDAGRDSTFVESLTRLGAAGALSLAVETLGFWLFVMGPCASFMFHRETGDWIPGDREAARQFAQIFATVWVFCRIPPVEGARWALVFALAPWLQDHVIEPRRGAETRTADDKAR